ncbi:hypothetical protein GGTG_11866 [Gaeumannomyces tritici R3-111a-1]|uniref:DUF2306 domain-containing protein n=1 Tax=Gaeumannomyces tritici (strain R3-111a-1) TaxID=644352 RepID=J3PED5_GAET3|nr:hypothetical protein GGTG_11866 [Gaeumannomyces tritici R3-111a-1]EJT70843.1 hypothetical protein GGTG_11866 [Gaeumannomyces tritici R3-111a-1]
MVKASRPPANGLVAVLRRLYNPLGFSKGYNFALFFVLAGALLGFSLARLPYLDYFGTFRSAKATEASYFRPGAARVGMMLHLFTIIPASVLVVLQFVPAIRHRAVLVHRLNGYLVVLLALVGTAGALAAARHAMGGTLEVQTGVGFLAVVFVGELALAWVNVRRLQIDQHRAWMLRAWVLAGAILTSRLCLVPMMFINAPAGYATVRTCDQIDFEHDADRPAVLAHFPGCAGFYGGAGVNGSGPAGPRLSVVVPADPSKGGLSGLGSSLTFNFGAAIWLAMAIHMIGVEIYLRLTPAESERLRNISYQRQIEAGMKNPGSAGLTADRLGDAAKWTPASD